jgi:hypothetical protein
VVVLVELAGAAVEDLPGQRVSPLLQVGLGLDLASVAGFVGQPQDYVESVLSTRRAGARLHFRLVGGGSVDQ